MRNGSRLDSTGSRMGSFDFAEFARLQELFNAAGKGTGAIPLEKQDQGQAPIGVRLVDWVIAHNTPRNARAAWQVNPRCVECTLPIDRSEQAALVLMFDKSHRIAHRGDCITAYLRGLMLGAATAANGTEQR